MAGTGIDDAESIAFLCQVEIDLLNDGLLHIGKIDGNNTADRGGGLIHQAAGLAEPVVLGLLAHLGDLHCIKGIVTIEIVENDTCQGLESGRGGKAGAAQHAAGAIGIKTADCKTAGFRLSCHAADQGSCRFLFGFHRICVGQIDFDHAVAFRKEPDYIFAVGRRRCHSIQIYACRQNTAALVVGVVAADLCASGCTVQTDFVRSILRESAVEAFRHPCQTLCIILRLLPGAAVNLFNPGIQRTCAKLLCQCLFVMHSLFPPFRYPDSFIHSTIYYIFSFKIINIE